VDDSLEARYHYLQGGELKKANGIVVEVTEYLIRWGFLDRSIELYDEVLQNPADEYDITTAMHNIGIIHQSRGEYDIAMELYGKSLAIVEKLGDINGVSSSYHQMGMVYQAWGNYDRALELYGKSLAICENHSDISSVVIPITRWV